MIWQAPWLQRFWVALESKPILAGGFAVGVCGFLVAGLLFSETPDIVGPGSDIAAKAQPAMMAIAGGNPEHPVFTDNAAPIPVANSLTPGSMGSGHSLFREFEKVRPTYVNASFPGRGN